MRLVVFSDLHLDTAFVWASPQAARARRQALRDTLRNVLALADEVAADAVLCAGDLYEHERFTPDTAAFLRTAFGETHRPVLVAPGNHDWLGPESLYRQVTWPNNVHIFDEDRLVPLPLAEGLTLWGAAHRAPANTDGFLDDGFRVDRSGVNLALFHGSERGSLGFEESGKRPHAPFAAEQLPAAGLQHAFVGHYHRPQAGDHHTYPGNPDPLTFGEDGTRGAVVADVASDGTVTREWRVVAVTAAHDLVVDLTGCENLSQVRDRVAERLTGLAGVARMTLRGELSPEVDLHPATDLTTDTLGAADIEALQVRTERLRTAYDLDTIAQEETVRGQFVRDVLEAGLDEDERRRVITVGLRALAGRSDLEVG
jgi:DNA repair protein SbcD/Mre11